MELVPYKLKKRWKADFCLSIAIGMFETTRLESYKQNVVRDETHIKKVMSHSVLLPLSADPHLSFLPVVVVV